MKRILITGGAGFIGSHVVRLFVNSYPEYLIINFDKLTYVGNLENLKDIEAYENYKFYKGDICSEEDVRNVFDKYEITDVIHLAAESHVDRSIKDPLLFVRTNVLGTCNLLNIALQYWKNDMENHRFHHVSTDEVYGSLDFDNTLFTESTRYDPHSPYSASKASSDHFVRAYHDTYNMNITISNCSNNYGPNQFPEKLIPLLINNVINKKSIPVYGTGENVRDWLYVVDHAKAIDTIFHNGKSGETYNIGGNNECTNIELIKMFINRIDKQLGRKENEDLDLITFITDRAGHDKRYAIDSSKLQNELKWKPSSNINELYDETIKWYLQNTEWLNNVTSGEYQKYYNEMYK